MGTWAQTSQPYSGWTGGDLVIAAIGQTDSEAVFLGDQAAFVGDSGDFTILAEEVVVQGAGPSGPSSKPRPKMVVLPQRRTRRETEEERPPVKTKPKRVRKTDAQVSDAVLVDLPPDMTRQGLEDMVSALKAEMKAQGDRRRKEDEDVLLLLQAALVAGVFDGD